MSNLNIRLSLPVIIIIIILGHLVIQGQGYTPLMMSHAHNWVRRCSLNRNVSTVHDGYSKSRLSIIVCVHLFMIRYQQKMVSIINSNLDSLEGSIISV